MAFFSLDLAALPDELYDDAVPDEKWFDRAQKVGPGGFAAGSLSAVSPLALGPHLERIINIPLYLTLNWLPFVLPLCAGGLYGWIGLLVLAVALGVGSYAQNLVSPSAERQRAGQYVFTERNNQKYLSMRVVWPASFEQIRGSQHCIFAAIPHGAAPLGITCYPLWSRLGGALCHWTTAPVVLQIPLVGYVLRTIGYIPAKGKEMSKALERRESVGVVLDGIAGMFQSDERVEKAWVKKRKAIVAIALKAGVPIVPVYGFGHSSLWTVVADPFRLLERLSVALDVALCPFYGRWGWPVGPPRRVAVCTALGAPIECPRVDRPSKQLVDVYHAKLLDGYTLLFEQHKAAFGWGQKELKFV
mmetsp:Transcript_34529/g.111193  ORF Transcript_34529/g.111193 Transcript_34529/m.111193 type:complete len:359 (-) Transcript_34529:234-1310(-)